LLIDEPAFLFWMLLGIAAGWGLPEPASPKPARAKAPASPKPARAKAGALMALVIAIAASIPFRVQTERANGDLEHRGVGLSGWHDAIDGVRFRLAGAASSVFVPAGAQRVTIPLRALQADADISVELRLDGKPIDVINVPGDRWYDFRLLMPRDGARVRFRRLDLRVRSISTADPPALRIGKVEPH
jgi:hypothetical protein